MSPAQREGRGGRAAAARGGSRDRAHTDEALFDGLAELFGHVRAHFERVVQPLDLPGPCAKALRLIDGSITMKDLSARIHCDASFVTAIADMLEERDLARRAVDPDDRRIKRLVLTDKGARVREKLVHQLFDEVPGFRNLDAADRETLVALLHKMVQPERDT